MDANVPSTSAMGAHSDWNRVDSKELSLTWDDHHRTLVRVFEKLLESSTLVDCTIAAEGQYLKAHKVVLSACSPYFELLFKQENEKNPIIVLVDVKFRELEAIIDFVYRGKVGIPEDCLGDFIAIAESLQIKGLSGGQKRDVSQKKDLKSPSHKTDGHVSPVLRKRVRRRHQSNHKENISSFSSVIDITSERDCCESLSENEEFADVPISFSSVLSTPSPNSASSEVVCGLRVPEEHNSVTSVPSTSYVQPVHSSILLNETDSPFSSTKTVNKCEVEPFEEIYLPETEDLMESEQELGNEELSLLMREDIAATENMCEQNSTLFSNAASSETTATSDAASLSAQQQPPTTARASLGRSRPTAAARRGRASPVQASPSAKTDSPPSRLRRLACAVSGKVFNNSSILERHLLGHTGERPFECAVCGKDYAQKAHLEVHMRVHTDERPFVCSLCVKRFKHKHHLQSHQREHGLAQWRIQEGGHGGHGPFKTS